ncbi:MAG: FAD:protein FMN transferase [Roseburia sp.]|nr:FAD:protein FMN transferase [Roseburia sp.]
MRTFFSKYTPLIFCTILLLSLPACKNPSDKISKSDFYFDTIITVTLYDAAKESLLNDCFSIADTYEHYFSATRPDSDVSKINQSGGVPVEVHGETAELIEKGLYYSELSGGGFDITVGNLTSLWDFTGENPKVPEDAEIQNAIASVDYRNVEVSGNTVTLKNPDARIDLGGIAKGYIADKMKEYLVEQGVTEGIINLGGNVLCLGEKSGEPYRIGVQKPFDAEGTPLFALDITDQTVVTSGVYERYFTMEDTLYHHILNPKTGYPYDNHLLSVTIICGKSLDADALSTTCFSLGLDKGMELIETLADTEAVFITDDNELHFSGGIGEKIPFRALE